MQGLKNNSTRAALFYNKKRRNSTVKKFYLAGENILAGEICYLTAGEMLKVNSSLLATEPLSVLGIALTNITSGQSGEFVLKGDYTTTGLTTGVPYYVASVSGHYTTTAPSTSGHIVRNIGKAKSSSLLNFDPSYIYKTV